MRAASGARQLDCPPQSVRILLMVVVMENLPIEMVVRPLQSQAALPGDRLHPATRTAGSEGPTASERGIAAGSSSQLARPKPLRRGLRACHLRVDGGVDQCGRHSHPPRASPAVATVCLAHDAHGVLAAAHSRQPSERSRKQGVWFPAGRETTVLPGALEPRRVALRRHATRRLLLGRTRCPSRQVVVAV